VDVRPGAPRTSLEATLADVQLGPLLKDVGGRGAIEGRGRAELVLSAAGLAAPALRHTLTGRGRLSVVDGTIVGVDLLASATRTPNAGAPGGPRTELSELTIPFTAEDGRIQVREATARSGMLHLRGGGRIDLVQETLNLKIEPRVAGEGGIGVRVTGPFSAPEVRPDVEGVARKALRKALEGDGDGLLRKPGDRLKGLLPNTTRDREDKGP
jgi:AsmA protein